MILSAPFSGIKCEKVSIIFIEIQGRIYVGMGMGGGGLLTGVQDPCLIRLLVE